MNIAEVLIDLAICVPTCATICYLLDRWRDKRRKGRVIDDHTQE